MAWSSRTGWYLRVLREGIIDGLHDITLVSRPHPEWTIERANKLVYLKAEGDEARQQLASLPELSQAWKRWLRGEE
jgi:MOSC domain-containing protein YiiM